MKLGFDREEVLNSDGSTMLVYTAVVKNVRVFMRLSGGSFNHDDEYLIELHELEAPTGSNLFERYLEDTNIVARIPHDTDPLAMFAVIYDAVSKYRKEKA